MNTSFGEGRPQGSNVSTRSSGNILPYVAAALSVIALVLVVYNLSAVSNLNTTKELLQSQINKSNQELLSIDERVKSNDTNVKDLKTSLNDIQQKAGLTEKQLGTTKNVTQRLRQQERTIRALREQLAKKADTTDVSSLREEANTKLGSMAGDLDTVKGDVTSTRKDVETTRRELVEVRDYLSQQIAHNKDELETLKRKGLRDYVEFDIAKKNSFQTVGDIHVALRKADQKRKTYSIAISVDDNKLEKKNLAVTEPVQFLVGKNRLRYELVVYDVRKDRVIGYLSVPKDKVLAAERAQN